jgi:hypothetical protein
MSVENTVFAAYALSSGDAKNEPATKAATAMIEAYFALFMLPLLERAIKPAMDDLASLVPLA